MRFAMLIAESGGGREIGLLARRAISLPPVSTSKVSSESVHSDFLDRVSMLAYNSVFEVPESQKILDPVNSVERVHFYLPYMGRGDDRQTQILVNLMYAATTAADTRSAVPYSDTTKQTPHTLEPLRVGFVSKFFGGEVQRVAKRRAKKYVFLVDQRAVLMLLFVT